MKRHYKKFYVVALIGLCSIFLFAQDEVEARFSAGVRFSPLKDIKLYVTPELRVDKDGVDKFLTEIELKYSPLKVLDIGASYELLMNFKASDPTEYVHRLTIYSEAEHKVDRFSPSLRIMFANYDEDETVSNFLRYRAKVGYDIPSLKIDPSVSMELYHELTSGDFYKIRYSIGADWRFAKKQSIGLEYKLDDYVDSDKVKHIIGVGYSFKF